MKKVGEIVQIYLARTETFIYQYLRNLDKYKPIVITNKLDNLEQFELREAKYYTYSFPFYRIRKFINENNLYDLGFQDRFTEKVINEEGLELLHFHFGNVASNYIDLIKRIDIPTVTMFYGLDASNQKVINRNSEKYKILFEYGDMFLVEGPFMKKRLINLGCPEDKIEIQRIAIDLDNYKIKNDYLIDSSKIRILFVGRITEKKGLIYGIEALGKLKNKIDFELNIIGDGPEKNNCQKKAEEYKINDKINWLGYKTHKEVMDKLHHTDIFLHPSVTASNGESEGGAPTIILEAQACGVPVVSTTHSDIPYITKPNESAFLADEKNSDQLKEIILELAGSKDKWENYGRAGREHVEAYHNIKKEVKILEDRYSKLIGSGK